MLGAFLRKVGSGNLNTNKVITSSIVIVFGYAAFVQILYGRFPLTSGPSKWYCEPDKPCAMFEVRETGLAENRSVRHLPEKLSHTAKTSCNADARQYILTKYNESANSDNNEHIPIIYDYVKRHEHATEIGVLTAVSSWAFAKAGMDRVAAALPFTYVASDITRQKQVDFLDRAMTGCHSIQYSFKEGNDLLIEPWHTDVLMIDTWHANRQLGAELERWARFARRYILLPNTESFADRDEGAEGHGGKPVDESLLQRGGGVGLWPAVERFVAAHPEWILHERRRSSSGLTVLRRNNLSLAEPFFTAQRSAEPVASPGLAVAARAARPHAASSPPVAASDSAPPGPNPVPLAPFPIISGDGPAGRFRTEVVIFVPTPVPWEERRRQVHGRLEREGCMFWFDSELMAGPRALRARGLYILV